MKILKHLYKLKNTFVLTMHTLIFSILLLPSSANADRFDPPSLKLPLLEFDQRASGNIFNTDFLLAHIINNTRKTIREVGEITDAADDILQNTAVFTNNSGVDVAAAGSVIIPPGTTADTIIIINQNEGDSIAIQR
jgi:hypothetical protein